MQEFDETPAKEKFDIFVNAYKLRNEWKLEPELMREINQLYGRVSFEDPNHRDPLDWRHPDCHAIYWAIKGLKAFHEEEYNPDESNTDRIVLHSLQNLFRNGKIFIYDLSEEEEEIQKDKTGIGKLLYLRPDLRMFDSYHKAVRTVFDKYEIWDKEITHGFKVGYRNMLKNAVLNFYQAGYEKKAGEIYKELREVFPERREFKMPLPQYAKSRMLEELQALGPRDAKELISILLAKSYFRYAVGDDEQAFAREKVAREIYDMYQVEMSDRPTMTLPSFSRLRYIGLQDFFESPQYPIQMKRNLLARLSAERPDLAEKLKNEERKLLQEQQEKQGSRQGDDRS